MGWEPAQIFPLFWLLPNTSSQVTFWPPQKNNLARSAACWTNCTKGFSLVSIWANSDINSASNCSQNASFPRATACICVSKMYNWAHAGGTPSTLGLGWWGGQLNCAFCAFLNKLLKFCSLFTGSQVKDSGKKEFKARNLSKLCMCCEFSSLNMQSLAIFNLKVGWWYPSLIISQVWLGGNRLPMRKWTNSLIRKAWTPSLKGLSTFAYNEARFSAPL